MVAQAECRTLAFTRKILLVEDTPINQVLVQHLLDRLNQRVVTVENGAEALERIQQEHFDLVFMDIQMPVMDGLTATRRIRDLGLDLPILALSAYTHPVNQAEALSSGCNEFLCKPVRGSAIEAALLRWFGPDQGTR